MHFQNEVQIHRLNVLEIIDSEKNGYLNTPNVPLLNTFEESTCAQVTITAEISKAELSW